MEMSQPEAVNPQLLAILREDLNVDVSRVTRGKVTLRKEPLLAAEAWVQQPESERREAALKIGTRGDSNDPLTWIALAAGWAGNLFLGRTFAWSKKFEERLAALTVADLNAALKKYIDPRQITVVKAGDFTRSADKPPEKTQAAN